MAASAAPPLVRSASPIERPRSLSLLPIYLSHSFSHILLGIYPAVLVVLKAEFDASYTALGAVFTAATLLYGLGAFPTGLLLNRLHPLRVIRSCLVVATLATAVIAAAPSAGVLAAGLLLLGIGFSPFHVAANTLISRVSGNDARITAHLGMFGSLGLAFAPAFGAALAYAVSWRLPFAVGGGITLLVLLSTFTLPPLSNPRDASADAGHSLGVTSIPALGPVFGVTICLGFIFRGFETYLPTLVLQRAELFAGSRLVQAGLLASLVYLVGFFGQLWAARLGRHRSVERVYTSLIAGQAALLFVVFLATQWLLLLFLLSFSLLHFASQPIDNVLTGKYTSLRRRGVGYGISFTLQFAMGSFAAVLGGALADAGGGEVRWVYLMLTAAALLAVGAGVALTLVARRLQSPAPPRPGPEPFDADIV